MEPFDTIVPLGTVFSTQLHAMMSLALLPMSVAESAAMDGVVMIVPYLTASMDVSMVIVRYQTPVLASRDGQGPLAPLLFVSHLVAMDTVLLLTHARVMATGLGPTVTHVQRGGRPWTATPPSARADAITVFAMHLENVTACPIGLETHVACARWAGVGPTVTPPYVWPTALGVRVTMPQEHVLVTRSLLVPYATHALPDLMVQTAPMLFAQARVNKGLVWCLVGVIATPVTLAPIAIFPCIVRISTMADHMHLCGMYLKATPGSETRMT